MEHHTSLAISLAERSEHGIAIFHEGFVYANPHFCDRTGWHPDLLRKMHPRDILVHHADTAREAAETTHRETVPLMVRHHQPENAPVPAEMILSGQYSALSSGMIVLEQEPLLRLGAKQLHDIRNPLNTILGYGQVLQDDTGLSGRFRHATESIVRAAEQIRSHLTFGPKEERPPHLGPPRDGKMTQEARTVMIVDDDADNRAVLGLFLKKYPFRLLYASNGAAAMELASRESPELIFMDLHMPDMNGREAARHIKRIRPESRIVALSADIVALEKKTPDFDLNLSKPFERERLREVIATLTGVSLGTASLQEAPSLPAHGRLDAADLEAIAACASMGRISTLETQIEQCADQDVRDFLRERLAAFDLEGIVAWCRPQAHK